MREYYKRFFDNNKTSAMCFGVIFVLFVIPIIIASSINTQDSIALAVLVFFLTFMILLIYSITEPHASYDADDTQVTFSYIGKKTTISYNDIKELKLERRNNEHRSRYGIQRCYVETLTITTTDETYVFKAQMDIDYDQVAADSADLTVQFENSKFSQLKHYIEERIYINI